ncbi:phage tail tube protein [Nonomuraea endophytica]|uniref:phage tail tube protein n=1 Tax=Nonomuraea endophytica TaxID=714136 RepID=UPI0037CC3582
MPATLIPAFTPYYTKENLKWIIAPSIANKASVLRAEINASTDISPIVADWDGWDVTSNFVDVPNVNRRFTPKIPGSIEASDSSLTTYLNKAGTDARQLLPRDAAMWVLRMDAQDVGGRLMDVFPVTVASHSKPFEIDGSPMVVISFAITDEPAENVVIPA